MARKSEYPAWEKFNRALTTYRKHQQEYSKAKPGSRDKSRLQDTLRDDGLRLQTYFNEQTRYNTTSNPSTILNPKTGKAAGQWHHAATQKRLLPFLLTVKTRQDYVKLTDAFKQYGIGIGNAYQNMFDLPGELHASNDPRAIHRVEELAGLDAPDRYLKPGATVDDAIQAIPYLAEDVTGSKGLARQLQMQGSVVGKDSRFSDQVMQTSTEELSQATHNKRARNRQTAQLAIEKRNKGLPTAKTITDENYYVVHGEQLADKVTPRPQVTERGRFLGGIGDRLKIARRINDLPVVGELGAAGIIAGPSLLAGKPVQAMQDLWQNLPDVIPVLGDVLDATTAENTSPGTWDFERNMPTDLVMYEQSLKERKDRTDLVTSTAVANIPQYDLSGIKTILKDPINELEYRKNQLVNYFKSVDP